MKKTLAFILILALVTSLGLAACSSDTTTDAEPTDATTAAPDETDETTAEPDETTTEDGDDPVPVEYKQSPMLDSMDLPPVSERIPLEPNITTETDSSQRDFEAGQYGGTLRMASAVIDWNPDIFVMCNEPLINTPGLLGQEITPNIVKAYEMSPDEKEFTFYMREGLKWSDGVAVTTEDVRFAYEDVMMNEALTPIVAAKFRDAGKPTGEPMQLDIIDDYTFKVTFNEPYGGFLMRIAIQGWAGYTDFIKPRHYLEPFHIDYADADEREAAIAEEGFETGEWENLFNAKDITNFEVTGTVAIGFPSLSPWILTGVEADIYTFERNPYYFKVDAEGNQLPYIDVVRSTLVADTEVLNVQILAGEIDFTRESTALVNMPLYKENEERSGFRTPLLPTHGRPGNIFINLTYDDDAWREVVQDVRFRQALNLGIDRDEIIDAVYYGFAELPENWAPTEYDPDAANALLDEMGLDQRDSQGWRIGPDGEAFNLHFDVTTRVPESVPQTELLVEYFGDLGIYTTMRVIETALWGTRVSANELYATVERMEDYWWQGDVQPMRSAPLWISYYNSGGESGEEPPAEYLALLERAEKSMVSAADVGYAAYEENVQAVKDNLFFIVTVAYAQQPLIVNEALGNVPHGGTTIAANFAGEQFFFRQ